MEWTKQQSDAIDARGSSVIVSAAAGSGKTAVLTERLIKLIADPDSGVRADRMVVVTFTNDAAAELKKRLDSKLRALINDRPGDRHLLMQQTLLQSAKISTINSFCFELIRDNITDQGVTSGFGVLDDTDNTVLRAQAMDELISYYSSEEYDKISFIYDRFCIKDDERLREVLFEADKFLSSVAFRDKWLDKAVEEYEKGFENSVYSRKLADSLTAQLEDAVRTADECCDMIKRIFPEPNAAAAIKSLAQSEQDFDNVSGLLAILRSGRFPTEQEAEQLTAFSDLVRVGKAPHDKALREIYKKKREKIKKLAVKIADSLSSVESDFEESAEVTKVLAEMLKKYQELLWNKKCEKNALSFDDGERLALDLLAEFDEDGHIVQSETAKLTAEYFDIIMIDEYQDSNNKQDMIFKLMSRNYKLSPEGEPMYGDNVFLVGDVKQSIYRFRLANPRNFISTLRSSEPYSKESKSANKSIFLNQNFRSSPQVIGIVNFLFSQVMSERCGDIEYNADEQLYFGARQYSGDGSGRLTHFSFINDDPTDSGEDEIDDKELNREAVFTAAMIAKMIADGCTVTENDGTERPCRPSDFCILVRKNFLINKYAEELEKLGIPAKGSEESGYLRSREIAVLIDLLRIISNPLLDVPMAAVMTSPMYMFSVSDLAVIKSLDSSRPLYPIIRGLADGEYEGFDDMFLRGACRDFLTALDLFRLDAVTMTLGELIASIYDETDFISVMQLGSDGEKKRANLRALIQYAQNYENAVAFEGTGGLGGFLRHLDRVMENGDYAQGKVSAESGDYVQIMTYHKSKGLEFPFVFIAETSCRFKYDSKPVMCSADGRIGYVLYDPKLFRKYRTFQQSMLSAEQERDTRSEEMRLLYVGMTRAKQQLFINLKCGEKSLKRVRRAVESCIVDGGDISGLAADADYFCDWIWAALFKLSGFGETAEKLGIKPEEWSMPECAAGGVRAEFEIAEDISPALEAVADEREEAEPDEAVFSEIKALAENRYDMSLSETPAKLSVTEITRKLKNEEESFDLRLKRPRFCAEGTKLTGAERGTAIHTFFQYCDFDSAINGTAQEIERIASAGYITHDEAASISIPDTLAFFRSGLYERICRSGNVQREKKFMVALSELDISDERLDKLKSGGGMIKGIIDLLFEEEGGYIIVDYKSDRGTSAQRLSERYAMQLKLYKAAIELTTGKKVLGAYLYSFELQKEIKVI